jgi:LPS export ABC transporter protein LptC
MEFTTSAAQFSGQTGMVTTAHPVSFSDASLSVQGTGMEFNVSTYKLRIHSDVRTVYKGGAER